MSSEINLYTAQGVRLSYRLAGVGSRAAAVLLDLVIQGAAMALISLVLLAAAPAIGGPTATGLVLLINFVVFFAYYIVLEGIGGGQTIGKRALGIRVVASDGGHCGWGRSVLRNLMRVIDWLPLFYGLGIVMVLATREHRRLGDFVGGTLVVYSAAVSQTEEVAAGVQPDPLCRLAQEDVETRLRELDGPLLRGAELMRRRGQLLQDARQRIAAQLRAAFESVLGPQQATSDMRFVGHVLYLVQALGLPQEVRDAARAFPLTAEQLHEARDLWFRTDQRAASGRSNFLRTLRQRGFLAGQDDATAWIALGHRLVEAGPR